MDYNPITYPFCKNCQYYKPIGNYIYLLNRPGKEGEENRKCKNLSVCLRISKMGYKQMSLFD